MSATEAVGTLAGVVEGLRPIDLAAITDVADLQERYDTKYVVPAHLLGPFVRSLGDGVRVLEVDARRSTDYRTTYFDTPDLATFRAHVQRRRRRYKIRTRSYGPELTTLEVKTKDKGGRTVKHRRTHPGARADELSPEAMAYVAEALEWSYGFALPPDLTVSAVTTFRRTTLLDEQVGERVTIDTDLEVELGDRRITFDPGHVLVETKSTTRRGRADRLLRELGVRPARVSKYGLGIAVLRPELPHDLWRPALRRLRPAD